MNEELKVSPVKRGTAKSPGMPALNDAVCAHKLGFKGSTCSHSVSKPC